MKYSEMFYKGVFLKSFTAVQENVDNLITEVQFRSFSRNLKKPFPH